MSWKDLLNPETGETPRERLEREGGEEEYTGIDTDREDFEEYLEENGLEFHGGELESEHEGHSDACQFERKSLYVLGGRPESGEEIYALLDEEGTCEIVLYESEEDPEIVHNTDVANLRLSTQYSSFKEEVED